MDVILALNSVQDILIFQLYRKIDSEGNYDSPDFDMKTYYERIACLV